MSDDTTDHDPDTGEVYEHGATGLGGPRRRPAPGERRRPERTPDEQAIVDQRRAEKDRMLRALEALSPALSAEGDPPIKEQPPIDVTHARVRDTEATTLRTERPSGRGGPGSALVVRLGYYDGNSGGEAGERATLYAEFADNGGHRWRTRGAAVRRSELRQVARVLVAYADELDAPEAADNACGCTVTGEVARAIVGMRGSPRGGGTWREG